MPSLWKERQRRSEAAAPAAALHRLVAAGQNSTRLLEPRAVELAGGFFLSYSQPPLITHPTRIADRVRRVETGIPAGPGITTSSAARQGWNLLDEDLHLPLLVLKETALDFNLDAVARLGA